MTASVFSRGLLVATAFASILCMSPASGSEKTCGAGVREARHSAPVSSSSASAAVKSWKSNQRVLIVVDGLSDGAGYETECRKLFPDVKVVHIQSSLSIPAELVAVFFNPEKYDASFVYNNGNLDYLVNLFDRFAKKGVRVVAGTETGVALADLLSSRLKVFSNGVSKSAARTDKELLAQNVEPLLDGNPMLKVIPGKSFENAQAAMDYVRKQSWPYPLVLKPTGSAGNYGFRYIHDIQHLPDIFSELVGTKDPLGKKIERLMIQPRLNGVVVAMNTVSHPTLGIYPTDMWRTRVQFTETGIVFLRTRIARFQASNPEHARIFQAAGLTARGLGIQFGPLHPEFLVTEDGMVYLMDAGARPAGGSLPVRARECGAVDQIHATLMAAFDPAGFGRLQDVGPKLEKELALLYFVSTRSGVLKSVPTEEQMRQRIPGYVSHDVEHMKVGKLLGRSESLFNQPGFVVVEGTSDTIDSAERAIRDWELNGFYQFEN